MFAPVLLVSAYEGKGILKCTAAIPRPTFSSLCAVAPTLMPLDGTQA